MKRLYNYYQKSKLCDWLHLCTLFIVS